MDPLPDLLSTASKAGDAIIERLDRARSAWLVAALISVAVVAGTMIATGPSRMVAPWDVFTLLEGGWRIYKGQIPSTDYYNPIGPLTYVLTALGIHARGPSLGAFHYGNVIFGVILTLWSLDAFFRKLPPPVAFVLTLFTATVLLATRPLGYPANVNSYAMIYNRYGWEMLSLLLLLLFVTDRHSTERRETFDAFSIGALVGLILFDKISYLLFAATATGLGVALRSGLRSRLHWIAIGFLLVWAGFYLTTDVNLANYAQDLWFAARAQSRDKRLEWLFDSLRANRLQIALIFAIWVVAAAWPRLRHEVRWRYVITMTIIALLVPAAAIGIAAGNAPEGSELPLFAIGGVILLEGWRRQEWLVVGSRPPRSLVFLGAAFSVGAVCLGGIFLRDVLSLANSVEWNRSHRSEVSWQRFDAPPLADFAIPATSDGYTAYSRQKDVPSRINEGSALLRRHLGEKDRIVVLAVTDPFSFALGLEPASGAPLWWDYIYSFDRSHFPDADRVFAEADYVIYPLEGADGAGCCWQTVTILQQLYGGFLSRNYVEIERSTHWVLLARRA